MEYRYDGDIESMRDNYPKFLPQWTKAILYTRKHRDHTDSIVNDIITVANKKFDLDWYTDTCCLTGEAFFHEAAPYEKCDSCSKFTFNCKVFRTLNGFYELKNDLAKHLQIEHTDIWDKWKDRI